MDEKHVPYRDSKLTRLLQVIRKGGSADVEQKSIHKHMIFDLGSFQVNEHPGAPVRNFSHCRGNEMVGK
eukprot:scaffold100433_cov19-Tisochrysis_lutea.AAC.1